MKRKSENLSRHIGTAAVAALGITALAASPVAISAGTKTPGKYVTGDFHNHTTCSDGTLSLRKLVDKSVKTFGLDWFVQAGHGGNSSRNCTLSEDPFEPFPPALNNPTAPPAIPPGGQLASTGHGPNQLWTDTVGNAAIKGDVSGTATARNMWKWQEIQDYIYPFIEKESRDRNKPVWVGLEQVVPGHEHASTGIIDGQLPATGLGNATPVAQYEYCFDRADTDTSRGNFLGTSQPNNWDCSVLGSVNNGLIDPSSRKNPNNSGVAGHLKTIEGVKWMRANYANTSYNIPAHLERAGAFDPTGSKGYNVEHLRDYNNAAPAIAFGMESMPGHQAEGNRGSYTTGAVGGGTFGGVGVYAAAIGGVWDALLGEGRNWFFFASSDYHNRGSFGPDSLESTADFFPGEYTKDYVLARTGTGPITTQSVVNALRSGNSFVANGDLIDRLAFIACVSYPGVGARTNTAVEAAATAAADNNTDIDIAGCATMGEKLVVRPGADIIVSIVARDPQGVNNSPYTFANPSLLSVGIRQPLNTPVLDHIDVIGGNVSGYVLPTNTAAYAGLIGSPAASNPSAALQKTFNTSNWTQAPGGVRKATYRIPAVKLSQYVRLRGSNLPPSVPFETDADGNPIKDFDAAGKIVCSDPACPAHLTTVSGVKYSSNDIAAWADLWFYSNPIFIEAQGSTKVAGIK